MYTLVIREKAQQQILDIYGYYEDIGTGLGDRFEQELDEVLDRIEKNPKHFQAVDKVFRRAHLRKFPYTIYYFEVESKVYVVAVWPQAGSSEAWREEMDAF